MNKLFFTLALTLLFISGSSAPVLAALTGPDPRIEEVHAIPRVSPGYPWTVSVDVVNDGSVTSGLLSAGCYLESSDTLGSDSRYIGVAIGDPLSSGSRVTLNMEGTIPYDLAEGPYHLYVVLEDTSDRDISKIGNIARFSDDIIVVSRDLPTKEELIEGIENALYSMTNDERASVSADPLIYDDDLSLIARTYAQELIDRHFFAHIDPDGQDPAERAQAAGYPTIKEIDGGRRIGIGENLAYIGTGTVAGYGYVDPTDPEAIATAIMDGWMKSPGHRKNILDALADRIGIGVAYGDDYYYAVQEFY